MKISYNWLKNYINIDLPADTIAKLLTDCGLEVESVEKFETVKGGLEGLIIGEVLEKEKHPDADRLNLTKVNVGGAEPLSIVCGAANVEVGQKVVVATVDTKLYPTSGESFVIKKSKIRGQASEGMICAEDEIGLGSSHEGIMILDPSAVVGTPAKDYFKVEHDYVFEIGLTPNRADATSHFGVARDLAAVLNTLETPITKPIEINFPTTDNFKVDHFTLPIEVEVKNSIACPRYTGVSLVGVSVKESPDWLKNKLKSIGIKPINNIVDVTNYVLHESGQPLHAFDADKIHGQKIVVQTIEEGTSFITLDGVERKLSSTDLMICDAEKPMCIAGVFGGINSGITAETKDIFLESAYFNPVYIRKTSKLHDLKTDASFRYERGADPNMALYALQRAAMLIKEVAGGGIGSKIVDVYPTEIKNFPIDFSFANCDRIIGKKIGHDIIRNIIEALGIEVLMQTEEGLSLSVPLYKVDVQREIDVIEEILRIYGYNNIETPTRLSSALSYSPKPDHEKVKNSIADYLSGNGFAEILNNSLSKSDYVIKFQPDEDIKHVRILNPLSSDLNVMRQNLLYGGLESISYNQNRKNSDL